MSFIQPVRVGDILGIYTEVDRVGRTSIDVHIEAWVRRDRIGLREKVTEATFKFVAVDDEGRPKPVPALEDLPAYVSNLNQGSADE